MHGRLKIKTTAEQQEAKKIEREKKLKIYKAGTLKIFQKRENKEYDDEALSLTRDFLQANPSFDTLWNFRKEILLHLKSSKNEEEVQSLGSDELDLTRNCIQTNLKAYGAWQHRFWSLQYMPHPDWAKELKLCDLFLSMDERNFHCWDYRRAICKNANVKPEDELEFTLNLIKKNFSNYSAWHYRSKLLPVIHPGEGYISVDENTLLKEYEIVQNAAFTDPNDQSAWFYHRWLLGRGNKDLEILNLAVLTEGQMIIVRLSCPIQINDENDLKLCVNETGVAVSWKSANEEMTASTVWYCIAPKDLILSGQRTLISVQLGSNTVESSLTCLTNGGLSFVQKSCDNALAFCSDISAATKDVLEQELESCLQLYEMEPESKWTLFTIVLLMKAIDSQKYELSILQHLDQLIVLDSLRKRYYQDLRSKFLIENFIETMPVGTLELNLTNRKLSSLHHFDYFILMQKVDLSNNNLDSITPVQYLLCVKELLLDNNKLTDCSGIKNLHSLEKLSLRNNYIKATCNLESLATCIQLKMLLLIGNPITEDSTYESQIKELIKDIDVDGDFTFE